MWPRRGWLFGAILLGVLGCAHDAHEPNPPIVKQFDTLNGNQFTRTTRTIENDGLFSTTRDEKRVWARQPDGTWKFVRDR
jgi:hypothetical protein